MLTLFSLFFCFLLGFSLFIYFYHIYFLSWGVGDPKLGALPPGKVLTLKIREVRYFIFNNYVKFFVNLNSPYPTV